MQSYDFFLIIPNHPDSWCIHDVFMRPFILILDVILILYVILILDAIHVDSAIHVDLGISE